MTNLPTNFQRFSADYYSVVRIVGGGGPHPPEVCSHFLNLYCHHPCKGDGGAHNNSTDGTEPPGGPHTHRHIYIDIDMYICLCICIYVYAQTEHRLG